MQLKSNTVLVFGHHADGTVGAFLAKDFQTTPEDYAEFRHIDIAVEMAKEEGFSPISPTLAFDEHRMSPLDGILHLFSDAEITRMARQSQGKPSLGAITVVAGFNGEGKPGFSCFFCPEVDERNKPNPDAAIEIALNHPLRRLADPCLVFDADDFKRVIYSGTLALRLALKNPEHRFDGLAYHEKKTGSNSTPSTGETSFSP